MNLWLSFVLSIYFHVLVNLPLIQPHAIRHQRHRDIQSANHTHPESSVPMSMSTGGCTDEPDCLSPSSPSSFETLFPQQENPPPSTNLTRISKRQSRQAISQNTTSNNPHAGKCLQEREERQIKSEYLPTCRKDGSYTQIQCHLQTKSCWCVTRGGRPITGSSVLLTSPQDKNRPNCAKYLRQRGKSTTQRRSSHGKNNRKSCNYADRSRFNVALIRTFRSEYNRYKSITSSYSDSSTAEASDEIVLSWKFDALDRNRDSILYKNETLILKHLVKQQIQPRACAKNFISFCAKGDQKIVKREWLECLRLPSVDNNRGSSPGGIHISQLLKPDGTSGNPLRQGGGIIEMQQETSNCWTDRQSALASQIRNESVIIPECTVNGLYNKVQCAQGKTYCWCVEEESGIQIPNTVVVNSVPDCNNRYNKPMKGCSGQKKQKFISDLLDTLMKKMTSSINEGRTRLPLDQRQLSVQEQSARWYFNQLDLNKNGILERPEWKHFRNEVSRDKRLKKCGKKLPRHCDVNGDRRLTMGEWVDCLGVELLTSKAIISASSQSTHHGHRRPVHRSNGRRNGKNPFTNILKQR